MFDNILENMKGGSETPAGHHLFDTAEDMTKVSQTNADLLYNIVAQMLYLLKQALPY